MARALRQGRSTKTESRAERREAQKEARMRKAKPGYAEIVPFENQSKMKPLVPLTERQAALIGMIISKRLIFALGPAGTGKTVCPVGQGLKMLFSGEMEQIILTRADFSIDGKWAPVPGDEKEKYEYLFRPMREAFYKFITKSHLENLEKLGKVKFEVLSNVLGRTFDNALIIFDECQVSTPDQTKALLTRMGKNTRTVLAGDYRDQRYRAGTNGLEDALWRLRNNPNVGVVRFDVDDIVRDDFVKDLILAYRAPARADVLEDLIDECVMSDT